MRYDKDKYEGLIVSSSLFSIDKEKELAAFKREARKMTEYLYCYLLSLSETKYEPYGAEIVEVAARCIKKYSPDKGEFLHYFNKAWKQEYGHIQGRQAMDDAFGGLHFSDEEERTFRKYMRFAKSVGSNVDTEKFLETVASVMDVTIEKVQMMMQIEQSKVQAAQGYNSDGDSFNLFDDLIGEGCTESDILDREAVIILLNDIGEVFNGIQNRQKTLMSMIITSKIAFLVPKECLEEFKNKEYFHLEIYDQCVLNGDSVSVKEISDKLGVQEASSSRSWKGFKEKLERRRK